MTKIQPAGPGAGSSAWLLGTSPQLPSFHTCLEQQFRASVTRSAPRVQLERHGSLTL